MVKKTKISISSDFTYERTDIRDLPEFLRCVNKLAIVNHGLDTTPLWPDVKIDGHHCLIELSRADGEKFVGHFQATLVIVTFIYVGFIAVGVAKL